MTGHRILLPHVWIVPGSYAPESHSQRHGWAKKTSQPSPGRDSSTHGAGKVIFTPVSRRVGPQLGARVVIPRIIRAALGTLGTLGTLGMVSQPVPDPLLQT